ncbi:tetratricopeptide repeat protein [Pseudoduganella lurida]|uniref:tetratricopeptide repeat protein n=1 Tax=Pseudoduganella lurida TaxID=1036180 RepID=UPI0011A503AD|nr:tetratricopeptide repeat protein [Pseudoduganella lurida]
MFVLLSLLLAVGGQAQEAPAPAAPAGPDLYMEAMRALGEGRMADATEALDRMIAAGPESPAQWLDLAMLQCSLGRSAEALALFTRIEAQFDPPPGVRQLIEEQRRQGCRNSQRVRLWSVQAQRGYDSNVNQGAANPEFAAGDGTPLQLLPEYLPRADHYTVVAGDYLADLNERGDIGFVQVHLRRNDHVSDYDTLSLLGGVEHPWRAGGWRMRSVALGGLLTLGGQLYQEQAQLQLRATPPLALPKNVDFALLGGVGYSHYRTLSNFNAATLELRGILGYRARRGWGQASLGYLDDRATGTRPGGDRAGWNVRMLVRGNLAGALDGELDWSRQRWHGDSAYSPGLIDVTRQQRTSTARAALSYGFAANQSLVLEWRATRNHENISIFQYDSRQVSLNWRWEGR